MNKLYMGFDAGTQSVKVGVYDEQFNCLTSHSLPTHLRYPQPGWVEMSADEFLEITVESMAACANSLKEMGRDPKDVCAVMGDGIICGIVGVRRGRCRDALHQLSRQPHDARRRGAQRQRA